MSWRLSEADLDFLPETVTARRRLPPLALSLSVACFTLLAVVLIGWASHAELDEVTVGQGRVAPSQKLQVVQNLEGGIVKEILVREGELVEANQVMVRIDQTGSAAFYGEQRVRLLALLAATGRLRAEAEDAALNFPDEVRTERPDLVANEQALFDQRRQAHAAELAILRQQLVQRRNEQSELRGRLERLARSHALIAEELRVTEPLLAQGAISRVEVLRLQRQESDLRGDLNEARLAVPRLDAAAAEIEQRIGERQRAYRTEAARELTQRLGELAGLREAVSAARDRVERTEVRAPVRGIVQQVKIRTIGGVIKPGQDIVEVVPSDDTLLVEARVRPADIAFLRPGLDAMVKITAYDFSIYGGLAGQVEHISATTDMDERTGEPYYTIEVRTRRNHLGDQERRLPIMPGMVTTVDVLTGKKTVLDYLLKPVLKARTTALRER